MGNSNLYSSDEYVRRHPSLFEEDSYWKITKIIPLVDLFVTNHIEKQVRLLDIGGGAGVILSLVAKHLQNAHNLSIKKFALDLSPSALTIQKEKNPDIVVCLNEDLCKSTLGDKEIDLSLMIDVLEHINEHRQALLELKRTSKFVIFKVPLQNNLYFSVMNLLTKGKLKKCSIEDGHVNFYDAEHLKAEIEEFCGRIIEFRYTNVFEYYDQLERSEDIDSYEIRKILERNLNKILPKMGKIFFKISPELSSKIFEDFIVCLVRCY